MGDDNRHTDGISTLSPERGFMALFGRTLAELGDVAASQGLPPYAARQMAEWLYRHGAGSIDRMTNLPLRARKALVEQGWQVGRSEPVQRTVSRDGTVKYAFRTRGDRFIECVAIPDQGRLTLCLSIQVGCRYGCRFCRTGRMGFHGNLSAGEILNQYASLPERDAVTNIVYMGMGEPLDNLDAVLRSLEIFTADYGYGLSPTRLTVSTVGLLPALDTLLKATRCHVAWSLHSPFPEQRRRLVPAEARHPLRKVLEVFRAHRWEPQRRLTVEYVMLEDINDTPEHAEELARLLRGLRCRINLIACNRVPGAPLRGSDRLRMEAFQNRLKRRGYWVTIRESKGGAISAACGMLAGALQDESTLG